MDSTIETIKRELPRLLREDPALRDYVLELTRGLYADRAESDSRFDRMLNELARDREAQTRKWDEQDRKWEEQNRALKEYQAEQSGKWQAYTAEQDRRWEESRREFDKVHEEIMAQARKHDRSIGALGARWGLQSEAAFRNALAGILEQSFGVSVHNVSEIDETGEVFGRPDQVELDIIIKNGMLLILELKSSIDKAGMYSFERKARFYERRHARKADRLIVISPMIEPKAERVARDLGIEIYGDSLYVPVD